MANHFRVRYHLRDRPGWYGHLPRLGHLHFDVKKGHRGGLVRLPSSVGLPSLCNLVPRGFLVAKAPR